MEQSIELSATHSIIFSNLCNGERICVLKNQIIVAYAPFGHFIKRNLTCAAGNLFSNMHNQNYNELYISLTQEMAGSEIRMNRLTAFFLIENSIDAESTELHPKLKEILLELRLDKDLFVHYYERIQKLLS